MKKPMYLSTFFSTMFFIFAIVWMVFGALSFLEILTPSKHSEVQDSNVMGFIFCTIGIAFLIFAVILVIISSFKKKLHIELANEGIRIEGIVKKVQYLRAVSLCRQSPYRINYSYPFGGKEYYKKSHLFWEIPSINVNDKLDVYVDEKGNSTLSIDKA